MKQFILILTPIFFLGNLQAQQANTKSTANNLPKVTYIKNGTIYVKSDYKAVISTDKKIATIVTTKTSIVIGALKCSCQIDSCEWVKVLQPSTSTIACKGGPCCSVGSWVNTTSADIKEVSGDDKTIKWEVVVLPNKGIKQ